MELCCVWGHSILQWKHQDHIYIDPSLCVFMALSHKTIPWDLAGVGLKRSISPFLERQMFREKQVQRESSCFGWFTPHWPQQPEVTQSKARSFFQCSMWVQRTKASGQPLLPPRSQAVSCMRSGAAGTGTGTHVGSWSMQGKDLVTRPSHQPPLRGILHFSPESQFVVDKTFSCLFERQR